MWVMRKQACASTHHHITFWFLHPEYWPGALAAGTPYFVVVPMDRGV